MKIRIKNIFIGKKTKEKSNNNIELSKVKSSIDNSLKNEGSNDIYKKVEIKKVYDVSNENEEVTIEKKEEPVEKVRRRKGYTKQEENVEEDIEKQVDIPVKETVVDTKKIKTNFENLFKNKNKLPSKYYGLLIAMVTLGAGSVYLATRTYSLFSEEDYSVYSSIDGSDEESNEELNQVVQADSVTTEEEKKVEDQVQETGNKDTRTDANTNNQSKASNQVTKTKVVPKVEPLSFTRPIQGEILKPYSIDKVIYSKTLELWKIHEGIDIKADIGTNVKTIEKGTVDKVYEDSFYGMTVVIDHGQGYKSSYSNLDKNIPVKEKQSITKGQKIGKVGTTSIGEIKDDAHIHFMLFKDNVQIDPSSIFK